MNLPDISAKVKIDDSGILATEAKLKALGVNVKSSLDKTDVEGFAKRTDAALQGVEKRLEPSGQAFLRFGKEGELAGVRISSSTAKTGAELRALEARARTFAASVEKDMVGVASAVVKLGQDGTASLSRVGHQLQATQTAATEAGGSLASMGNVGAIAIGALVVVIVGLTAVLAPLLVQLAAATAILTAFAVGWTAVAASWALSVAPLLAVAAGVVLLAEKTGHLATPMQALTDHAKKMADTLGKQAAPMAERLIGFIDSLLPRVEQMGSRILDWFGARMPAAMSIAEQLADLLFKALDNLGRVIDSFTAKADFNKLWPIMAASIGLAITGLGKLLDNLLRLSNWFIERLPTMGPIAAQILGKIGDVIQDVGKSAGKLVDWFVAHWPEITGTVNREGELIGKVFKDLHPLIEKVGKAFDDIGSTVQKVWPDVQRLAKLFQEQMAPSMKVIMEHGDNLKIILGALVIALGIVVVATGLTILIFAKMAEKVFEVQDAVTSAIGTAVTWFRDHWGPAVQGAGDAIKAFGGWINDNVVPALKSLSQWIGSAADKMGSLIEKASKLPGVSAVVQGIAATESGPTARASGGPVLPGSVYRVGEAGPETLVMGRSGGYVIPDGGGGGSGGQAVHIHLEGATFTSADLARELASSIGREMHWQGLTG